MNAVQTHGTKDANKDNINVAFSLKLNFSKENDHLKRWNELYRVLNINETIDKFLNIDLIDDYFEEFGYDNEMFNSNGWFYDID